jgi:ATP-dependent RNA helicase DHX29
VSQANARQRQGRAGRVRAGHYYALFTRQRAASLRCAPLRATHTKKKDAVKQHANAMWHMSGMLPSPFPQPEMLRVALSETALQIKKLELGPVAYVLSRAPDPPAAEAVRDALKTLTEAGALDAEGALTPLGHHLARLPVDVRAGKIIVLGAVLGCLRPSLTIAAYLSSKSPFVAPHEERDAADRVRYAMAASGAPGIAAGQRSDHLVVVAAYDGWRAACASGGARAGADYCRRHCLCPVTLAALHGTAAGSLSAMAARAEPEAFRVCSSPLTDMRSQFAELLAEAGFLGNGAFVVL